MAQILSESIAPDGYDVTVTLSNGDRHVFHSASGKPADVQAFVDSAEADYLNAVVSDYIVTAENGAQI